MNRERVYEYRRKLRDGSRIVMLSDENMYGMYENGFSPSAADEYEHRENARMMRNIISACLSKQEKAVVIHIFYDGCTQEQTSKIMGISQPTVNIYLKRALCKLKDEITKYGF